MNDVDIALRRVWLTHRQSVLTDLARLVDLLTEWNRGTRTNEVAASIEAGAHRVCGSLTIVGRGDGIDELRELERRAITKTGSYTKEVVDQVHDLLDRLRSD